jgi:hypothetical protein
MFEWLPPDAMSEIDALRADHGEAALARVAEVFEGEPRRLPKQGSRYVMPGISNNPWMEPRGPLQQLARTLEAGFATIKREVEARIQSVEVLEPYRTSTGAPTSGWNALYLYKSGKLVHENAPFFAGTLQLLSAANQMHNLYSLGELMFSVLEPGTKIAPHCDPGNFWVPFHQGITIPEKCSITVADETRSWEEGKCLVFDASFEHHACNDSALRRIILLAEVWHPDVTSVERQAIAAVFRSLMQELS